jgi:Flp pilus assembly secretin CpaC
MSNNFQYTNGLGNVGSYQISSIPFLSSSLTIPASGSTAKIIEFPNVTRTIVITNTTDPTDPSRPFKFAFSAQGITGDIDNNYVVLDNGESFTGEFRVIKVFLVSDTAFEASGSVVAGLTGIQKTHLLNNWSGSAGVG